ncbi:hypothetical protein MMUR_27970 [Mycolicibacterium murale]|uniref:Molecular chaperone n=1 Tax=Mycolicibacterium murale TaxID=182220 RepID=A0A7I9WLP1_9MYCO|nr:Hsp70 family protein [Mycolicibacterium murale]MCV7181256.1 Hsp70 family protein [Mycolicibacterium murale]GFG58661.1 hypothetical protein MMUR_27970 [Mycolicibacterium murale]
MTGETVQAVGLSIGATGVAAVTSDTAVVRTPVLTLTEQQLPVVGTPEENPQRRATAQDRVLADFVDRVGDPVGILASDGSSHRGERVLAEALRSLTRLAGGLGPQVRPAVSYPAHWRTREIDALRAALRDVPEWSRAAVPLIPDATAAAIALHRTPGLPTRGVIALCDFGGSGTSITLLDAAAGYRPIGPTVRHLDFSGDLVDQALLTHVMGGLADAGAVDLSSTSAIGSLTALRRSCRSAKERLSQATATTLPVDLPGHRGEVRLTRTELDEVVRAPLQGVLAALDDTIQRNGLRPADVVAVATVGGAAAMVAVTATLSHALRAPVITAARPALAAATGAALHALRTADDSGTTAMVPASMTSTMAAAVPDPAPALAWSQVDDVPESADGDGWTGARPYVAFVDEPQQSGEADVVAPWYRRPALAVGAAAALLLVTAGGVGIAMTGDSTATQTAGPSTAAPAPPPAAEPVVAQPPSPVPVVQQIQPGTGMPAPVTRTQVIRGAAPALAAPPPAAPATSAPPTTTPPSTTTAPPTTTPPSTTTAPPTTTPPSTTTAPPTTTPPNTPTPSSTAPSTAAPPASSAPETPVPQPDPPASDPVPQDGQAPPWTLPPLPIIPELPALGAPQG